MDERPDSYSDAYDTQIRRVKPEMGGRSLALPPVAPIVGVLGLAFGLLAGFGLAPAAAPAPTPASTAFVTPSPAPSIAPSLGSDQGVAANVPTFELPPGDGLSLADALKSLDAIRIYPVGPSVVSARVVRWTEVWPNPAAPAGVWVWAITVQITSPFWCTSALPTASEGPLSWRGPVSCTGPTTEMFVLDYHTGDFLEAMSPSRF
jgi:hypothetical protein